MSDTPHVIDTDTEETAEEFLQRMSGRSRSPAREPGQRRAPASRGRRPASSPVRAGGVRPWLAASASILVPGLGQWLNRERALSLLFVSTAGLAGAIAYSVHGTWKRLVGLGELFDVAQSTLSTALFLAAALLPLLWLMGIVQAYARATRGPRAYPFGGPTAIPGLASVVVPGWGQLLNGQLGKALTFLLPWSLGAYVALVSVMWAEPWAALDRTGRVFTGLPLTLAQVIAISVAALAWIVAIYDAFLTARKQRNN